MSTIATAGLALLLTGCVSTNRTALAPDGAGQFKTVHVTATVSQPELGADVHQSNIAAVTGGGLIAALVDVAVEANRSKKAENLITPLRDALVDFDPAESLRSALETEFLPESPLAARQVSVEMALKRNALRDRARTGAADATLFVEVDYRLSPEFDRLRVSARATLLSRDPANTKPAYVNCFATYRGLPTTAGDKAACVTQWAENKGALAREALLSCFAELADMVEYDLVQGVEANTLTRDKLTRMAPPAGELAIARGVSMRGAPVHDQDQRTWVRFATGELSSTAQ